MYEGIRTKTVERGCGGCQQNFLQEVPFGTHENSYRKYCDSCDPRKRVRECRWCKSQFIKKPGDGSLTAFCSVNCRTSMTESAKALAEAKRAERAAAKAITKTKTRRCSRCRAEFVATHGLAKYCPECAVHIAANGREVTCEDCSAMFVSKGNSVKRCVPCRVKAEQARKSRIASIRTARAKGITEVSGSQQVGLAGELIFDLLCVRRGWLSARPVFENNPGWDRLIIRDGATERVQVKSVCSSTKADNCWVMFKSERPINSLMCDVIAIVDVSIADVWLIPIEQIPARTFHPGNWEHARSNAIGLE